MHKILIAYTTRTKKTQKIAELIAQALEEKGLDVTIKDIKDIKDTKEMEAYDGIILGAPTYHGKMMGTMETFLFQVEQANLSGKIGGAFGAYGWSGEAPQRIYDTMENIFKMKMIGSSLKLKNTVKPSEIQEALDYGAKIAGAL